MPSHIDELADHIRELDDEIDRNMKDEEKAAAAAIQEIPGIGNTSAEAFISAIGTDMSRFPTDGHISSWAGLCPGSNESAKKRRSGKTRKGNALLRSTLVVCVHSAVKVKNSYFCAQFQRISAHRGKKRAYVAAAHSMLIAIYHILEFAEQHNNRYNLHQEIIITPKFPTNQYQTVQKYGIINPSGITGSAEKTIVLGCLRCIIPRTRTS